ncbi:uncharacterized protein RB166_006004 [Leptodactylus fuscus]|uniref:uncharacterized protein LOC142201059 n=1 Tax=Leptodactylus fuscus TaxID=238119 RepID=UPI003F4EE09C
MRALMVLGFLAFGILLVAATHQDQSESGLEAKNERGQGDFAPDRAIRSTGGKKKTRTPRKPTPGVFSAMSRPSSARERRQSEDSTTQKRKPRKCIGCYSFSFLTEEKVYATPLTLRKQRDTEEPEKMMKKQKHLKEKGRGKGRRHKNHRDRHAHFQEEDPESGHNNNKRRKHHRGKKNKEPHRVGRLTALGSGPPHLRKMENRNTQDRID